ncbi:hypothetical protein AB837_00035 [bacterium AB1]|nr:hypothetical protein AB837_00035 [bacterium AB1]
MHALDYLNLDNIDFHIYDKSQINKIKALSNQNVQYIKNISDNNLNPILCLYTIIVHSIYNYQDVVITKKFLSSYRSLNVSEWINDQDYKNMLQYAKKISQNNVIKNNPNIFVEKQPLSVSLMYIMYKLSAKDKDLMNLATISRCSDMLLNELSCIDENYRETYYKIIDHNYNRLLYKSSLWFIIAIIFICSSLILCLVLIYLKYKSYKKNNKVLRKAK